MASDQRARNRAARHKVRLPEPETRTTINWGSSPSAHPAPTPSSPGSRRSSRRTIGLLDQTQKRAYGGRICAGSKPPTLCCAVNFPEQLSRRRRQARSGSPPSGSILTTSAESASEGTAFPATSARGQARASRQRPLRLRENRIGEASQKLGSLTPEFTSARSGSVSLVQTSTEPLTPPHARPPLLLRTLRAPSSTDAKGVSLFLRAAGGTTKEAGRV